MRACVWVCRACLQPVLRYNEIWVLKESRRNDVPDGQQAPPASPDASGVSVDEAARLAHTVMW